LMQALGFEHVREIAGPRALAYVRCELTDHWEQAGVLEPYRRDLEQRYAGGCLTTVRPTVLPDALYPDLWLTGVALEELEQLPVDRPWLLWVNFPGPHEPFDVPASWRGRHDPASIPAPSPRPSDALHRFGVDTVLGRKLRRWPEGLPEDAVADLRADYADHLALLDAQVARLMGALCERADAPRTAISACSDHGELLGDWGLLLKGCFLKGASRSLFVHCPPGGRPRWRRSLGICPRAYSLTALLQAASVAVSQPGEGSFGSRMRTSSWPVAIDFADERQWRG